MEKTGDNIESTENSSETEVLITKSRELSEERKKFLESGKKNEEIQVPNDKLWYLLKDKKIKSLKENTPSQKGLVRKGIEDYASYEYNKVYRRSDMTIEVFAIFRIFKGIGSLISRPFSSGRDRITAEDRENHEKICELLLKKRNLEKEDNVTKGKISENFALLEKKTTLESKKELRDKIALMQYRREYLPVWKTCIEEKLQHATKTMSPSKFKAVDKRLREECSWLPSLFGTIKGALRVREIRGFERLVKEDPTSKVAGKLASTGGEVAQTSGQSSKTGLLVTDVTHKNITFCS